MIFCGAKKTDRLQIALLTFPLAAILTLAIPAQARKSGDRAIPPAANSMLIRAYRLLDRGDAAGAAEVLESFRARRPKWQHRGDRDPEGYFHYMIDFTLGNCYLTLGNYSKATASYQYVLTSRPDFFPAWANLAKAYYDSHRFAKAARAFEKAFKISDPVNGGLLYDAAVAYVLSANNTAALSCLRQLLARHPGKVKTEWREYLVHVLLRLKRNREALPHIRILARTTHGRRQKQWQEVCLQQYMVLKLRRKALAYAGKLVHEDPLYPLWWKMLANLNVENQRYTDALASLMICGYLTPLGAGEMRLAADLSLNLGIPIQAVRFYEGAWQQKKDPLTLKRLVFSYRRRHRPEKALEVLRKGLRYFPRRDLELLQARILLDMQRYRRAEAVLKKLTHIHPESGRAWLMLGYAAMGLREYTAAGKAFRRASCFKNQHKVAMGVLKTFGRLSPLDGAATFRKARRPL